MLHDKFDVFRDLEEFVFIALRAVIEQAVKQETVQKLNLFRVDPERQERIEIKRPNFDILNAFADQTIQRLVPLGTFRLGRIVE